MLKLDLEKIIKEEELNIIKKQLDNILNRYYEEMELESKLEKIINNYEEGNIDKWDDETIYEIYHYVDSEFTPETWRENALWELWYIKWYIDGLKAILNKIEEK